MAGLANAPLKACLPLCERKASQVLIPGIQQIEREVSQVLGPSYRECCLQGREIRCTIIAMSAAASQRARTRRLSRSIGMPKAHADLYRPCDAALQERPLSGASGSTKSKTDRIAHGLEEIVSKRVDAP
jgi:hypothetical protein